ncbi:MAG TPA: peptidoglycan DD-metalloendopeptidase family protein [Bacillota bacterium]
MQNRFKKIYKSLKSKLGKGFTLMMIPNSGSKVKSIQIPFVLILCFMVILAGNIYMVIGFVSQKGSINYFKTVLTHKNQQIERLNQEQKLIRPTLEKTYQINKELNRLKQERVKLLEHWKSLQEQNRRTSYPVSRGVYFRNYDYKFTSLQTGQDQASELTLLNHNIDQLKEFIEVETREQQNLYKAIINYQQKLEQIPSLNPLRTSRITSWFGRRLHPKLGYSRLHTGIDLSARIGTKVHATASGIVTFSGYKSGYGYTVILDHGQGYQTLYAHNSKLVVKVGQQVKRGAVISYSGNTGTTTGPHLHYEVRVNGKPVNPIWFIKY